MSISRDELLDKGLYSIYEAIKLSGASASTVRRWLLGYTYKYRGRIRHRDPIFSAEFGDIDGQFTISFRDLVELLFVTAFRERGVKWAVIHEAFELARERFESEHPFSVINFKTDGKRIFEETVLRGRKELTDLNRQQFVISDFIEPTLLKAIECDQHSVRRWYPAYPSKLIVLDPKRSFGRPVITSGGVPTEVIWGAFQADQDVKLVAEEFDTKPAAVRAAVKFEKNLAA